ncbi:hypothetical protein F66182_7319 [Fusarium sp. NRRL 66182]|nr:hypothetical protein F66182_7319 [Fusarium sp. NRRL 66182]
MSLWAPSLPRLMTDADADTGTPQSEPASDSLLQAIAETLSISRDDMLLFDSFTELGGDEVTAELVRLACESKGLDVTGEDIMGCLTLAELQTRITPRFPSSLPSNSSSQSISGGTYYSSEDEAEQQHGRSRPVSVAMPTLKTLLQSFPSVSSVCMVKPRAGPFDGQLVALIKIDSCSGIDQNMSTSMSVSEVEPLKQEISLLRMAVQECAVPPQIWIPLSNMPAIESTQEKRRLQTWVQNLDENTYREVMKLQIPSRRRRCDDTRRRTRIEATVDQGEIECFSLSPMQQLYFQAINASDEAMARPERRYTQSVVLNVKGGAEPSDVDAAIEAMVARHDMLRARFMQVQQDWMQFIHPQVSGSYRLTHHIDASEDEMLALGDEAEAAIDPVEGPVFAALYIHNQDKQMLHLAAHHLVVDAVSWRIILGDLDGLLHEGALSDASMTFSSWIDYQNFEAAQRLFEPTLNFDVFSANLEYWDVDQGSNSYGNASRSTFYLGSDKACALEQASAQILRTDAADVLLAALLLSFCQIFPERNLPTPWKQESGRDAAAADDFNIAETVGWFTTLCPVGVSVEGSMDLIEVIKLIKDTRRRIPKGGVPFFTSQFFTADAAAANVPVEIIFSSIDTAKQLQQRSTVLEPVAVPGQMTCLKAEKGPDIGRTALFEIAAMMDDTGAQIDFVHSNTCLYQDRIQAWIQTFERQVLEAISKLQSCEPQLTLSDVPLLQTSYQALTKLASDRRVNVKHVDTIYPVTPAQQEILIAQAQNMEAFHGHVVYELKTRQDTPVDTARLYEAWGRMVVSTPALRSIFIDAVSREGLFDQVILKKASPSLLFIETSDPDEAVSTLPALNMSLGEPRHRLSVCHNPGRMLIRLDASQAICDASPSQSPSWMNTNKKQFKSLHLLVAELSRIYSGQAPHHHEALHSTYLYNIASTDVSYSVQVWKTGLSAAEPCIFPRLSSSTGDTFQTLPFDLDVTRTQLDAFCQQHEVETAAVLQLAWALVLRAFVGMDSVVFGYQFNARDEQLVSGIGELVGSFAALLPCMAELPATQSLKQCLVHVGEALTSARKHDNLTMAEIQYALGLKDKSLFNTCLYFQDDQLVEEQELMSRLVTSGRKTDCDASLTAMFVNDGLHANFTSRYLSVHQIKSVTSSFGSALTHILQHPDETVAETDLLTEQGYAQLNASQQQEQKISLCLHDVILQHSLIRPDATAVCSWDGDITYSGLATLVSRLQRYLVNHGVGPGTVVPVVLEKNRWAAVILLAVLQAGACFVALDCLDPLTAQSTIDHLTPGIVLATQNAWGDINTLDTNLVIINNSFFATLTPNLSTPTREAQPEHAACVLVAPKRTRSIFYTHSSLLSAFVSQGPALKINNESRVLQLSSFNVDISLVEILGTMVHGGCVCIPSAHDRTHDIAGAIAKMDVTWSYMTSLIARKIHPDSVPSLRTLCFRTRRLDPDMYTPWLYGHDVLLAYGAPDICPLGISITQIAQDKSLSIIHPPVRGRFRVLNPDNQKKMMPVGAVGELAIDSPLVTPNSFALGKPLIANPPDEARPQYLKTGHSVRYLDDGNIEFISSVRDEVKISGLSIDVAQVEQQIRRCLGQGIDVVVDAITTRDAGPLLAAFLELGPSVMTSYEELSLLTPQTKERTYVAKKMFETSLENPSSNAPRLARHCIPSVFIPVRQFPTSTSLKVNRRRLQRMVVELSCQDVLHMSRVPRPDQVQRVALAQKPLPLTGPEESMREMWADVIGTSIHAIKGSSTFASVGGNKFLAAQLIVACRKMGLHVSLMDLLGDVTLSEMCRAAESSTKKRSQPTVAKPIPRKLDAQFVNHVITPQLRCSPLDYAEASSQQIRGLELAMFRTRADIICLVVQFNGPVDVSRLETACQSLVAMHDALCVSFISHEHRVYQVQCSFKAPFKTLSCAAENIGHATQQLVKQHQHLSFDPAVPVTDFTFLGSRDQGALVVRLSRAQVDDVSVSAMVQDLASLYKQDSHETTRPSYIEYTRSSRATPNTALEYWKRHLENARMTRIMATSRPALPEPVSSIKSLHQTTSLGHLSAYGMTPDSALGAAWAIVLSTVSSTHDVLFGQVTQSSDSHLVGPLTNTVPMRVQFPASHSTPLDLMNRIQIQRQAHARFQAYGLHEIVTKCTNWRACTQFSTIVQHQVPVPSSTINVDGATFSYDTIHSSHQDFPDLFVRSTLQPNDRIALEIKYPQDRIPHVFAQSCLSLLIAAWETLTHPDTIHQPMIHSSDEIARSEKQIPLPARQTSSPAPGEALGSSQRKELQEAILSAWNKVINPAAAGIPKNKLPITHFYAISKTILSAHSLATHLNQVLPITLTVEDVLAHPSMHAQFEFVAPLLPPKQSGLASLLRPKSRAGSEQPSSASTFRNSIRNLKDKPSMLNLSSWGKSKSRPSTARSSLEDAPAVPEASVLAMSHVPTIIIPDVGVLNTPVSQSNMLVELDGGQIATTTITMQSRNQHHRRSSGGSSWGTVDAFDLSPSFYPRAAEPSHD